MEIKQHQSKGSNIAEIISDKLIIEIIEDGTDLLGNMYYQGFDKIIIHKENIIPEFFELKNGMAGEILQKFSTYRVRLVVVGDFKEITRNSKSLRDFIYESNKGKQVNFLSSVSEAIKQLSD